jgi:hypothetical protein
MSALTHFYSYATGVSLELPAGFERVEESDVAVGYADLRDTDVAGPETPALQIQVVAAVPDDDPDGSATVARVADQLATAGRVLDRVERTVDECPVVTVEVEREGSYLHLSAAAVDGRVLSIAGRGTSPASFTTWDAAVESMRFITL